jgi:hypothetical protein
LRGGGWTWEIETAADELVTNHLQLAAKLARRYKGYGLPLADLVAEANLGLVMPPPDLSPTAERVFDPRVVLDESYNSRLRPFVHGR